MKSVHFARILPAIAIAGAFSMQNAVAEPAPLPQTDFTAQWDLTGGPEQMQPSRITYSTSLNKMRVDMKMQGQEMTMIRDMGSGSSDFHIRTVALIAAAHRIGALATASAHSVLLL